MGGKKRQLAFLHCGASPAATLERTASLQFTSGLHHLIRSRRGSPRAIGEDKIEAVDILGVRQSVVTERPEPRASSDIVKVKLLIAPMCTEWQTWRAGKESHELGHEGVGVVVDAAASKTLKAGDRVVVMPHAGCGKCPSCLAGEHIHCTEQRDLLAETGSSTGIGCYAQYLLKPDYLLWKVPDDISTRHAAMAVCALGPTFTAMRRMQVTARDTVLVSGCGAVGLGAIVNAKTIGARVIALEIQPYRRDLALALGASEVFDPRDPELLAKVRAATGGYGPDAIVETSNSEAAPPVVVELVKPRGRLAFITWSASIPVPRITGKGIDIFGCWHWNHQEHGAEMAQRVRLSLPLLDKFATHSFPMTDVQEAFALQETGMCGKVLLFPFGEAAVA